MKFFSASTQINASPETLWNILTDASNFPKWDTHMIRIEGRIAAGEKIAAYTTLSPDRAFTVTVTEFEPHKRMVWSGGLPLGLFKSARTFEITPNGSGVTFTTKETFSGLLLPIFGRTLPDLNPIFAEFCAGLKAYAEKK